MRRYLELGGDRLAQPGADANPGAVLGIESIELVHPDGKTARCGEEALLRLRVTAREPLNVYRGITIWTPDGTTCITSLFDTKETAIEAGRTTMECHIPNLPLVPGRYLIRPVVADQVALAPIALGGAACGGALFSVEGEADLFTNGQLQIGQLIAVNGTWSSQRERKEARRATA